MAIFDPYVRRVNPALGKNHDELLYDPARDMEPATKRYVDSLIAGIFDYATVSKVGAEYGGSWGGGINLTSILVADVGQCLLSPMHVTIGSRWVNIRGRVANASNSVHRVGIYALSQTTWLPTALLLDIGTMVWAGAGGDRNIAIDFTSPTSLIALGWLYESRSDAVNPSVPFLNLPLGTYWPPGYDPATGNLSTPTAFRIRSTGNAPGAMPAIGTFSLNSASASASNIQVYSPLTRGA